MGERLSLLWLRVQDLRWRRIALVSFLVLVVVMAVPPLRRAAAAAASRGVLVVVSPFAPSISGFDDLPEASKVVASDGTVGGRRGKEERQPEDLRRAAPPGPGPVRGAAEATL